MKQALSPILVLVVAAGLAAACGNDLSGKGAALGVAEGGQSQSVSCGGSGETCCNQTACNAGLTCQSGTCHGSIQVAPTDDATTDAFGDEPGDDAAVGPVMDAAANPDVGSAPGDDAGGGGMDAMGSPDVGSPGDASPPPVCVASGAACTTTNPGACGPGTSECNDAGVSVCRPTQTSQSCYTGPAGTEGVGLCKGGSQTCIGALGACKGEVVPAARDNCFAGTDDDCNGIAGKGCPDGLTLGADRPLAGVGGMKIGTAKTIHCPAGSFITRADSWFDDVDEHVSGVSIYCATPALVQGSSSYSVKLTPSTPAPYQKAAGTIANDERMDDCGTSTLSAITSTSGLADTYVEGLGNHCGTSAVTLNADNTITFDFAGTGDTGYNAWSNSTGTFFDQACNANEVMVGFTVRLGVWMDAITPICAALQVTYK
jgi:hypothetical protein